MLLSELTPNICDFHVHVGERIAGYQLRDGFKDLDPLVKSGQLRAIGAFVTEESGPSLKDKLRSMQKAAREQFSGHAHWHLTPIQTTADDVIPLLSEGCDLKLYTTYKSAGLYSSYEDISHWMSELSDLKTRILVHCEDDATVEEYSDRHPFRHPFQHSLRRPEAAEIIAVERVLDLAARHKHPVHIVHVSSPRSALLIQQARDSGVPVTCETAPHYLLLNDEAYHQENSHRLICTPPFRNESSRGMLVELLQDGLFDILASDHCAFNLEDKDRYKDEPAQVPCGIAGVETLFPSVYQALVKPGKLSLERLLRLTSIRPAELMGLPNPENLPHNT